MQATGGGDCGIRVWNLPTLMQNTQSESTKQFTEHNMGEGACGHDQIQSSTIKPDGNVNFFPRTVRLFGNHMFAIMSDKG